MTELLTYHAVAGALQQEELFPIREVSRLTGINPVTLRAWERRYGLIQPTRTESGHRLYSQADIDDVRSILGWIERGVAVSKVGKILAKAHVVRAETQAVEGILGAGEWGEWQARLRIAINGFDERQLERLYGQVFSSYPIAQVFQDILMPVWREFASQHDQHGRASEWLFLDSFLRGRTLQRLQLSTAHAEQRVVLASIPGHCLELELWVAALMMCTPETAIIALAPGQPLEELGLVCGKMKPDALVVFSNHPPTAELVKRLVKLGLGLCCPLVLAGEAADILQDNADESPMTCLGSDAATMRQRLQQFLTR
ncbi:MerR family transcriptional regulator [Pseudomonas huanghezhanensis]|uniref:MerR family transcriptional regulator n=1 Tax=Pseudomonas huanghezhanensis TaxID=3002903 RepID=UPI002286169C|nr:MerR family transcriptional regulator [Pseudomonas sp. BSw22131]